MNLTVCARRVNVNVVRLEMAGKMAKDVSPTRPRDVLSTAASLTRNLSIGATTQIRIVI